MPKRLAIFWPCKKCGYECWGHVAGLIKGKVYCLKHYKELRKGNE